ncbi:MAG: hypothetical protein J6W16_06980 [Methanobrevibacter sp.]|nr:hypothetical protein [Methanobrevibacter sp.]MBP5785308.1 hypothetical protein [Methanobrevibacter sp.]
MKRFAAILKTERNEYAKQIRKDYESHKVSARRCEMKQIAIRTDGLSNTITTINKDNLVIQSVD